MSYYQAWGKRSLDFVAAAICLVILSPVLVVVAIIVRAKLGSPVVFRQARPGKNGKIFTLYKFRTMLDSTDIDGKPLSDEKRLTNFGKLLRSTSLDELPELWNILRGDMSFIGPRPLLTEYLPLYSKEQARRHEVSPGLTGLAQVSGRNSIDWPSKFKLDVEYVDNINFKTDCSIAYRTVLAVLKRTGISSSDHATMKPFEGEV